MADKSFVFRFANVEAHEREFSLVIAGQLVSIEPKAFRVLLILLRKPKKLIPKEELLNAVWGDAAVTENSLTRAIALLRRVLGDDARDPKFIETVATVGYRWITPVDAEEVTTSASTSPHNPAEETPLPTAIPDAVPPSRPIQIARQPNRLLFPVAVAAAAFLLAVGYRYLTRPLPLPHITAYTQLTHDGRGKFVSATDGNRIYFTQTSPNQIMQLSINGGEPAVLPLQIPAVFLEVRDTTPDGSGALIEANVAEHSISEQWLVPILGGAAKRLEDGVNGRFSPDGKSIIYSLLDGEVFIASLDGTQKHKLATVPEIAFDFRWSPDGSVIRFGTNWGGIWEMSPDGSGLHQLLADWKGGNPIVGDWTPNGDFYLFPANGQIWALDQRRSAFRSHSPLPFRLTSGPLEWRIPVMGRDGKTVFLDGVAARGELSRIDSKSGTLQPFLGGISAEYVSFSPDGKSLAYVTFPQEALFKANRDGTNPMQLTQSTNYVINPVWSPDSKEIVFIDEAHDGHDSIRRISAEDGAPLWLLPGESDAMHDPNWSPDGKRVLFAHSAGHGYYDGKRDLRIVDLGTHQVSIVPGSDGLWSPRWSRDGRFIVAFRGLSNTLSILDSVTQQWRTLPCGGDVEFPNFSHDGRTIYFLRFGHDQGIFRIPVAGGKPERVFDLTAWHLTGLLNYSMSLDPTDAPLVLRDTGTDDIYALTLAEK